MTFDVVGIIRILNRESAKNYFLKHERFIHISRYSNSILIHPGELGFFPIQSGYEEIDGDDEHGTIQFNHRGFRVIIVDSLDKI